MSRVLRFTKWFGLSVLLCSAYTTIATITPITVKIAVQHSCTVSPATLAFGNYTSEASAALDAVVNIHVTCTNTTSYKVGLDAGLGPFATVSIRKMTAGSSALNYSLYQNAGRTIIWGNTTTGTTNTVSGTGTGTPQQLPVYGRVFPEQVVTAGTYNDRVTIMIYF